MTNKNWKEIGEMVFTLQQVLEEIEMAIRENPDGREFSLGERTEVAPEFSQAESDLLQFMEIVDKNWELIPDYMWR